MLAEHPHLHVLVTAGGLAQDGSWRLVRKNCLFPRRVVMQLFRGKLRALLGAAARRGELLLPPGRTLPPQQKGVGSKKESGVFCRNGPKGASHKRLPTRLPTPFCCDNSRAS